MTSVFYTWKRESDWLCEQHDIIGSKFSVSGLPSRLAATHLLQGHVGKARYTRLQAYL